MGNITEITRRDIVSLFRNGYDEYSYFGNQRVHYSYYGRLSEIEFLKKLYHLNQMPSYDPKHENAAGDILQHTVNNDDWESGWVFSDDRFELLNGGDTILLRFLCCVFHPENRAENGAWKTFLSKVNDMLRVDGYELYESEKISGRNVYSWRRLTSEEIAYGGFFPFSMRHKQAIEKKSLILQSIPKQIRSEFISLFNRYEQTQDRTTETGWNYWVSTKEAVIEDAKVYYTPKAFDESRDYCEAENFDHFVMNNYPYCVFDAIEFFARLNGHNNFADEVNLLLQRHGLGYKLLGGKIEATQITIKTNEPIKEQGLKEIMEQAMTLYNSPKIEDKQLAVEKLWDAFERLKTYYTSLDKRASANKVVEAISNGSEKYKELFNEEFKKLTDIGNTFRIRHHETDKIDITDSNYYSYFFQRCYALVSLAVKYLK